MKLALLVSGIVAVSLFVGSLFLCWVGAGMVLSSASNQLKFCDLNPGSCPTYDNPYPTNPTNPITITRL